MSFESLGLDPELLRAIQDQGYTEPTPVQAQAIPLVLQGKDVQAAAQTGTGKTAGFTLPILQRLLPLANTSVSPARHPIRALVLTPTRELAAQVEDSVKTYGKYVPLRSAVIYGGVPMDPQIKALQGGVEIVVATPGRLLDHVQQRTINLGQVEILVLDEADRMLDMGFIPDIRRIVSLLPKQRQNLLFSATFSDDIKKLSGGILQHPVTIEVARRNAAADLVQQWVFPVHTERKRELLVHLICSEPISQAIVFTRTKHGANRLCHQLERAGILAAAIHSDKTQAHRTRTLAEFKEGQVRILVATDVAARGLDIDQLPYVINYELPHVPEDYIHRIGRTGRAGSTGCAFSLVGREESKELAAIERLIQRPIEQRLVAGYEREPAAELGIVPQSPPERGKQRGRVRAGENSAGREPRRARNLVEGVIPEQSERRPLAHLATAPIAEAGTGPRVHQQHEEDRAGLPKVRREQPAGSERTDRVRAHFTRPPLAALGRRPREIPALLGGFAKKKP